MRSIRPLFTAPLYREILLKLRERHRESRAFFEPDKNGECLYDLIQRSAGTGREISQAMASGSYRFQDCAEFEISISGKTRRLFRFCWRDRIVHAALSQMVERALQSRYPPCLYSYRKGIGGDSAIHSLLRFAKTHRRKRPDKRSRGIYFLKADIHDYGESIPVARSSLLWEDLRRELSGFYPDPDVNTLLDWLCRSMSPELRKNAKGEPLIGARPGLPNGSPLVPPLNNLYLLTLDRELTQTRSSWYGRYGDDILLACESQEDLAAAREKMMRELDRRSLAIADGKLVLGFWNGAGRASKNTPGTQIINYLGKRVSFDGGEFPKLKRRNKIFKILSARIREASLLGRKLGLSQHERVSLAAAAVRNALEVSHPFCLPQARDLSHRSVDRRELLLLERRLQLEILVHALGLRRSKKSFRVLPPSSLIELGFPPLSRLK